MIIYSRKKSAGGFSLLEVLIAVIVLATGLLALASLQAKLTSNSSDSKTRSRIVALMTGAIDQQRASGYPAIVAFGATACSATGTEIQKMICSAQSDAGIGGLTLAQTVSTFYATPSAASFGTTAPAASEKIYGEYKKIQLTANWTDAAGVARTIGMTTLANALGLTASATILTQPLTTSSVKTPVVHEANPGLTSGVIPIAVGANTDTAATNPKPQLGLELASTSYNTLTYTQGALDTSATATIQKRVETTVAECVCGPADTTLTNDVFLGSTTFRPTYWNGLKYKAPLVPSPVVTPVYGPNRIIKQSDLCTQCCRDHHDASTDTVKYDATTGDYNRYKAILTTTGNGANAVTKATLALDSNGAPIVAGASDNYLDACRLIRVDGLWRVATDTHVEHMGLLATATYGSATTATPDSGYATSYENFVLDFLGQKLKYVLGLGVAPNVATIFNSYGLNNPGTISATTLSSDYRYLHSRGLYIDHLEQEAIDKLTSVNTTCAAADFPQCLLPYLPFTTINVTEVANWTATPASPGNVLTVTNTSTACTTGAPIRGCVQGKATGNGSADVTLGPSNSALASSLAISPYDRLAANSQTDSQAFTITGTATSSEFFANLTGLLQTSNTSTTDDPSVTWTVSATSGQCSSSFSKNNDTDPNPYDCVTTVALATPMVVTIGSYNQVTTQSVNNPCPGAKGNSKVSQPVLTCSVVTAATVTGITGSAYTTTFATSGTAKTTGESTDITINGTPNPMTKGAGTLNVTFGSNGSAAGTYTCNASAVPTFTTPTSCP
jgi:type II secretory pathway pseudopilin PulG